MALVLKDRVKETTASTGTGTVTLAGAVAGFQSFSAVGDGNTTYYAIVDAASGDWEVGIGTYTASGTTLSRTTVLSSSNAGSLVNFGAGTKDVFVTYPSSRSVYQDTTGMATVQNEFNTLNAGTINVTTANITGGTVSTTPTSGNDLVNKTYVDTMVSSGITYHAPVKYEVPDSVGNLNATYNNGTAGVGATLTNAGTLAAFAPDGPTAQVGDRVLVYNQTNAYENGVYTVTTVGSGSVAWVLTRATDADSYALKDPNALGEGDAFFITSGNTGAGETYVCNTTGTITFGTTAITFVQVSDATLYTAGTGLTLSGTQFSITNTGVSAATYGSASSVPVIAVNAQGQATAVTDTPIAISGSAVSGDITGKSGGTTAALTAGAFLNAAGTFDGSTARTFDVNATSNNTASTVVARDASGNFSAGTITATLSGSATSATTATNLAGGTANQIPYQTGAGATSFATAPSSTGQVLGWNGSAFTWYTGTISGVQLGSNLNSLTAGSYLTGSSYNGSGAVTFAVDATSANTASKVVARDASGNFSAGTITASLNGNASTATTAANVNNGTLTMNVSGTGLSGSQTFTANQSTNATFTVTSNATSANTASTIVARDGSGNFSAGTITAALNGNASTVTTVGATQVTNLYSPNAATVVSPDATAAMPTSAQSFIHTLGTGPGGNDGHLLSMTWTGTSTYGAQIFVDTDPTGTMALRQRSSSGVWTGWQTLLNSGNYNSYAPTLTGGGASGTWGINITGNSNNISAYTINQNLGTGNSPTFVGVNLTGNALQLGGTNVLSKGATWSEIRDPSGATKFWAGNDASIYMNASNYYIRNNDSTATWVDINSSLLSHSSSLRAPIFYDSNNTGYYLDPNSVSYLYGLTLAGGSYFRPNNWIQLDSSYGLYWPNNNGAHFHANASSSYGQLMMQGNRNGWGGIYDSYSAVNGFMYDSGGNGGVYREANGRWYFYYHLSNDCMSIGTSTTSSTYGVYCNKGAYFGSRVDGTIFYDANNTGYYLDPNSTTALRTVGDWRADSAGWTGEFSGKIQYHNSSWYFQSANEFIFRNSGGSNVMTCSSGGNVVFAGNVTAYSDARLKENVATIDSALDKALRLRGVYYNKIGEDTRRAGVIAQEVLNIFPEVVRSVSETNPSTGETQELYAVDYGNLAGLLIEAIKELSAKVDALK